MQSEATVLLPNVDVMVAACSPGAVAALAHDVHALASLPLP